MAGSYEVGAPIGQSVTGGFTNGSGPAGVSQIQMSAVGAHLDGPPGHSEEPVRQRHQTESGITLDHHRSRHTLCQQSEIQV
eukprot:250763-Ditylum_brightwellii.AAC.1